MLLSRLIEVLHDKRQTSSQDPDISSIAYDSRRVMPGALFVCIQGERFNGHGFVGDALSRGASAILAERMSGSVNVPVILVPDTRQALPILANHFFDYPSRRLKLIGVTGTKGKTTTTYLIEAALESAGLTAGVIGTLGARIRGEEVPLERTTPESVDLQELLARMVSEGVDAAAMEVSSHALAKRRTEGCEYDVSVFTNLTRDHLDFHKTLEDYLETKMMLFSEYPKASKKRFAGIINADDPAGEKVCRVVSGDVFTYGIREAADIRASNINAGSNGVSFDVSGAAGEGHVDLKIGGVFNVYNSLAAIGSAWALGLSLDQVKAGLESVTSVAGRFESVDCGQDFGVIVDYAHTPDSLENILRAARELTSGRLIVVFGCGGDRDKGKRPQMGGIASELADISVITSDNPRSEDPQTIIDEIVAGSNGGRAQVSQIVDRREAIRHALEAAQPGDLVVIAGKGHETYQIFADRTIHFDDREVVRELLADLRHGRG